MQIESLEAFPIRIKTERELKGGSLSYPQYQTVIVRLICDGEMGWGEAMTRFSPKATAILIEDYFWNLIRNIEFDSPDEVWEIVWKQLRIRGHTRGISMEALSGIEIAMWDAYAKLRGKSIASMLSEKPLNSVPCYAGSIFHTRGPWKTQLDLLKSLDIPGVKVKVGFGIEQDVELLRSVRKHWEGVLIADANGNYDRDKALACASRLREFELEWFEEPVASDDIEGYRALSRAAHVPIGAGETWSVSDFQLPISERLVRVIQPSVSRCGGIKTAWEVSKLAHKHGILFSPMVGMNSAISLAASLQVAAVAEKLVAVEYDPFSNPLIEELSPGFPTLKNGRIILPRGNGTGLEIDFSFIRRNMIQ